MESKLLNLMRRELFSSTQNSPFRSTCSVQNCGTKKTVHRGILDVSTQGHFPKCDFLCIDVGLTVCLAICRYSDVNSDSVHTYLPGMQFKRSQNYLDSHILQPFFLLLATVCSVSVCIFNAAYFGVQPVIHCCLTGNIPTTGFSMIGPDTNLL